MDSVTDENIWAKRYDSSLDDFFKVQDEVTRKIVTALEVKLAANFLVFFNIVQYICLST